MTPATQPPSQPPTASLAREPEGFRSKAETARRLNCSLRTLDAWMNRGVVPYYKIGRKVAFRWSEVETALRERFLVNRGGWKF